MAEFRRLLVHHDFSKQANGALKAAAHLAAKNGKIVVLHVVVPFIPVTDIPPSGVSTYVSPDELLDGARRQLTSAVAKTLAGSRGIKIECKVEIGDPHDRIIKAARSADVVVMSTTGRTGLAHLLIGSVTEKVVRHSPVPVLTMRPEAVRKAQQL